MISFEVNTAQLCTTESARIAFAQSWQNFSPEVWPKEDIIVYKHSEYQERKANCLNKIFDKMTYTHTSVQKYTPTRFFMFSIVKKEFYVEKSCPKIEMLVSRRKSHRF
jgi:hypothetical protein